MSNSTCLCCNLPKSNDEFDLDGRYIPPRRKAVCTSCINSRRRKRYKEVGRKRQTARPEYYANRQRRHNESMSELKMCPCADCGNRLPSCCMEFDHVILGKSANVGNMRNYALARVADEVALCAVVCCNCHRVRTNSRLSPTRNQRLLSFRARVNTLKSSPCSDCLLCFNPVAMDFDHVRGTKFKGIAALWSYSWDLVLEEIKKCDLVCANCHRLRTVVRMSAKAA
jgi:hypothetical protein